MGLFCCPASTSCHPWGSTVDTGMKDNGWLRPWSLNWVPLGKAVTQPIQERPVMLIMRMGLMGVCLASVSVLLILRTVLQPSTTLANTGC